jgi:hypothetical protein
MSRSTSCRVYELSYLHLANWFDICHIAIFLTLLGHWDDCVSYFGLTHL